MFNRFLPGEPIESVADAKAAASRLGLLLEEQGLSLPRHRLLEIIARLAGAHHYTELARQLGGAVSPRRSRSPRTVDVVLPSLAQVFQRHCAGEITIDRVQVLRCEFELEHDFHTEIANLVPEGIAVAARLASSEQLTEQERQWVSGDRYHQLVVELDDCLMEDEEASRGWTVLGLAQSRCLGDGLWETELSNLVRFDTLEPWIPESSAVALPLHLHRQQAREARAFVPPLEFADYSAITVNIESRLMRLLAGAPATIPLRLCIHSPCGDPSSWMWAHSGHRCRKLRAALLRSFPDGEHHLVQLYSHPDEPLGWLSYQISRLSFTGELVDRTQRRPYHGEEGLKQLWNDAWTDIHRWRA
jgi:hypothetical protein